MDISTLESVMYKLGLMSDGNDSLDAFEGSWLFVFVFVDWDDEGVGAAIDLDVMDCGEDNVGES
jgi:hypothetical protein